MKDFIEYLIVTVVIYFFVPMAIAATALGAALLSFRWGESISRMATVFAAIIYNGLKS